MQAFHTKRQKQKSDLRLNLCHCRHWYCLYWLQSLWALGRSSKAVRYFITIFLNTLQTKLNIGCPKHPEWSPNQLGTCTPKLSGFGYPARCSPAGSAKVTSSYNKWDLINHIRMPQHTEAECFNQNKSAGSGRDKFMLVLILQTELLAPQPCVNNFLSFTFVVLVLWISCVSAFQGEKKYC